MINGATNYHNHRNFKFKLNLITLTLPSKQNEHSDNEIKHRALNNFFTQLRTKHNLVNYVWKAEKQKNGNIHFHIITDKFFDIDLSTHLRILFLTGMGYISSYRENQKSFHKDGFKPRPELFKKWSLKKRIEAYKSGVITNWTNPHSSFDVHSLRKESETPELISAKYLTKNPDCYREYSKRLAADFVVANQGNYPHPDDAALLYETVKKEIDGSR